MARKGLPLWAIQYLGRWGSDSVRLYTAQAYADRLAQLSLDVAAACAVRRAPINTELWELPAEAAAAKSREEGLEGEAAVERTLADGVPAVLGEAVADALPQPGAEGEAARFVVNRGTAVVHRVAPGWSIAQPRASWRAACGWGFAGDAALLAAALPRGPRCGRHGCFKGCAPEGEGEDEASSDG